MPSGVLDTLEIFEDAFSYLKMSLRTYVSATHVLEKLLASRLIVISMVMSVDALSIKYEDQVGGILKLSEKNFENEDPLQAPYYSRVAALRMVEDNYPELFPNNELSQGLSRAIDSLLLCYDDRGISNLLNLDFKTFLNEAQFFVLKIRSLIAKTA
ncbi:MAG: hypothetical protein ACFFCQ_14145 [Promethearchaeota archaeon]